MFSNKAIYSLFALLLIQIFILFSVISGYNSDTLNGLATVREPVFNNISKSDIASETTVLQTPVPSPVFFQPPELSAHAYFIKIIGDERPLAAQREWKKLAPASLTKILTALIAREELTQSEAIAISEYAKNTEDKRSPLQAGDALWRDDLMRLVLIPSYNDAALALAEKVGERYGGITPDERIEKFVGIMNKRAELLGLKNSSFKNPSGLDARGHEMNAEDIVRLAEYVWQNQRPLWDMTRTAEITIRSLSGIEMAVKNTNELLQEFPALLGGKTGLTDNAKGTLLLFYPMRPDRIVIIVLLGSEDRFGDGRKIIQWLETVK
ncbi:MAG: D-alanyl-D-alanine carboxypeptidase [Candidatus Sungbacteria bacterium]|nr:D-alanyl-D-alanine carboxypeptidase [Candidatus Sungbacteria bacterium]